MKKIGNGTFQQLIEGSGLYVDKTEFIYELAAEPKGEFLFLRPNGFGKSLTVSTMDALFRGKKELFRDLHIADAGYSFEAFPVIHIDFAKSDSKMKILLEKWLFRTLNSIGESYGVSADGESPAIAFGTLIENLYKKYQKGVVILIDEYDRPVTSSIEDGKNKAEEMREVLESFYQMIKGYEGMCRFVFVTGRIRLSGLSFFDNLLDLSGRTEFAGMAGYTEKELQKYFKEYIEEGASTLGITKKELILALNDWYGGFCFVPNGEIVYNPLSIGNFFLMGFCFFQLLVRKSCGKMFRPSGYLECEV